ncbi:MAG: hypothetical protein QM800_04905 [Paludibacter sp.]
MKKNYYLIILVFSLFLAMHANARVIQVAAPADISSYVSTAIDGDTIELTTSGGAYEWYNHVKVRTNDVAFTLRAKTGLAKRPVVTSTGLVPAFLELSSFDTTSTSKIIRFEGIDFDGFNKTLGVYTGSFYTSYLNSTTYYGMNLDINNCIFRKFKHVLIYYGKNTSSIGNNNAGTINMTNSECRDIGTTIFLCDGETTSAPNIMKFSNCLFYDSIQLTTNLSNFSSIKANIKYYSFDHCTFININGGEVNIPNSSGPSVIQNSLFVNSSNVSYPNVYSVSLGSDCGIHYTAGGIRSIIYPNSSLARTANPLLDTITGIATSSVYLTGSTDGKRIGYYGNQSSGNQITCSTYQMTGLDYSASVGPSAVQSFTVSATGLTNSLVITPPANYEISPLQAAGFSSLSITISPSGGNLSATPIYVRLKSGLADNTYTGDISISSVNFASKTISLSGTVTNKPTIYGTPASLSGLTYMVGNGPSVEKSFTISAINLTSAVTVTPPANYEISPLPGASFMPMSSISIAQSGGKINATTIYVRLKSGLSVNTYSGILNIVSAGAITQSVSLSGSVTNVPVLTTSTSSINGLYGFYDTNTSNVKTFSLTGTDLKDSIRISVPYPFEASLNGITYVLGSVLTIPKSMSNSASTIYVRLNSHLYPSYDYNASMVIESTQAVSKTVALSGRSMYQPSVVLSATSLSGMDYLLNNGPSAIKSFTVSGSNLVDNVVITPTANFEISTTGGSAFSAKSSISFAPTAYNLSSQTIYVRLKAGLSTGGYAGSINCTSSYATNRSVAVSGTVSNQPVITTSTLSLSGIDYNLANGSFVEKSFTVSGNALSSIILVSAPADFEISTSSGSGFSPSGYILISQSGGTASPTTIYVRMKSGLAANSYNETISIISTGAVTQNVACSGDVISPVNLTLNISGSGTVKDNTTLFANGAVLTVNKGSTKTFTITPGANYTVYSIKLNGVEVKSNLVNNQYTTGAINGASTLSVVFTVINAVDQAFDNSEKVYGANSNIIVEGIGANENVYIFDSKGGLVQLIKSTGERMSIPLRNSGLYLVKTQIKTYKVIL